MKKKCSDPLFLLQCFAMMCCSQNLVLVFFLLRLRIFETRINAFIFPVKNRSMRVFNIFKIKLCCPLDPTNHLYCRLLWSIYTIYVREKLCQEGGEHNFILKILKTLTCFVHTVNNLCTSAPSDKRVIAGKSGASVRDSDHFEFPCSARLVIVRSSTQWNLLL